MEGYINRYQLTPNMPIIMLLRVSDVMYDILQSCSIAVLVLSSAILPFFPLSKFPYFSFSKIKTFYHCLCRSQIHQNELHFHICWGLELGLIGQYLHNGEVDSNFSVDFTEHEYPPINRKHLAASVHIPVYSTTSTPREEGKTL